MIMARNEDGTYSQVGFVKDNSGIDTEYIYDKDGDIVFEKGFTREASGTVPLTINGIGKDLKDWSITGNTVQDGTPTPENPIEVQSVGDRTGNLCPPINSSDGWVIGYRNGNNGNYTSNNVHYEWLSPFFELSDFGTSFTISADKSAVADSMSVYYYNGDSFIASKTSTNYSGSVFNNIPNGTTRFCFAIRATAKTESEQIASGWRVWVNAGSTALPYEPYGYKIPVVTRGKNLFNCNDEPTLANLTKMYTISNLDINKYYTCSTSFEKIPGVATASLYFAGGNSLTNGVWKNTPRTFKPDANGQIAVYVRHITDSGAPSIFDKVISGEITVMVEEGATATPYEPYHEPITTPIYIPTPLYSGEVMRSDGTITRSDGTTETFTAPQIPTLNDTTVIDVDTKVEPSNMYIKYKSSK